MNGVRREWALGASAEARRLGTSRQVVIQWRAIARGLCVSCGGRRNLYAHKCDACHLRQVERVRQRGGYRPWKPGGNGRPPKWARP